MTGTLAEKSPDRLVVDVGGVGYAVHVSLQTFADLPPAGTAVRLLVHTEVREDAIELFGFRVAGERALFQLLCKVKGLGPRTALVVLSGMPWRELAATVAAGDAGRLQTIPGVGKKLAERIVVECREAATVLAAGAPRPTPAVASGGVLDEAISALVNLGYRAADVKDVLTAVMSARNGDTPLSELIRAALKELAT
ncbi:MAG TPA: Holliday junction branch migration protein RuvA [Candidatus Binatia bacterium]|nr:Holliday junction branch migration protein RuvA [Candidatus Binatia bacterium]